MATRPSSIINTPRKSSVGITGRPISEELFAYNLELALLSVLQKEDEYGPDSIFKWRSDKELYQNAWTTPTFWDWSSSGSASSYVSESSTPGASTPPTPGSDEEISFEPPRAWSMIRSQIQSKLIAPIDTPRYDCATSRKRKISDEIDENDDADDKMPPRKKARWETKNSSISINELTPPSSPPSQALDFINTMTKEVNGFGSSPRGISYGEITPLDTDDKDFTTMTTSYRRSPRLHPLPP